MSNKNCGLFEFDDSIALDGDKPCCQVCKYFNNVTDACFIGGDDLSVLNEIDAYGDLIDEE